MTPNNQDRSTGAAPVLPEEAKCLDCGYRLRGLPKHICPECGSPFDPNDPTSYHSPSLPNWIRQNSHPPRKLYVWCFFVILLLTLLDVSSPGHAMFALCLWTPAGALATFFLSLDWVLKVIARRVARKMPGAQPAEPLRRWMWTPIMICIVLSVFVYPWPAYLRFQMSRQAFLDAVTNPPHTPSLRTKRIGLFWVKRIHREPNGCVFFNVGDEFLDMSGFWYVPTGLPPLTGDFYTDHEVAENWYIGGERF